MTMRRFIQEHRAEVKYPTVTCSFCCAPIQWRYYAGHLDRVHPGGRAAPRPMPTKSMADLLLEGAQDGDLLMEGA